MTSSMNWSIFIFKYIINSNGYMINIHHYHFLITSNIQKNSKVILYNVSKVYHFNVFNQKKSNLIRLFSNMIYSNSIVPGGLLVIS